MPVPLPPGRYEFTFLAIFLMANLLGIFINNVGLAAVGAFGLAIMALWEFSAWWSTRHRKNRR